MASVLYKKRKIDLSYLTSSVLSCDTHFHVIMQQVGPPQRPSQCWSHAFGLSRTLRQRNLYSANYLVCVIQLEEQTTGKDKGQSQISEEAEKFYLVR